MSVENASSAASTLAQRAFVHMGASGPRTIVSVYPLALEHSLLHEGRKIYRIEASPRDGFSSLFVPDTFASLRSPGTGQYYPAPVPASVVVENLVSVWTRGRLGSSAGVGPGVLIVEGVNPSNPTPEEIKTAVAAARARQEEYFRYLINDADIRFTKEGQMNITDDHRMAAEWMGVRDRKWAQKIEAVEPKHCPACGEEVLATAIICKHCGRDMEEFVEQRNAKKAKAPTSEQLLEAKLDSLQASEDLSDVVVDAPAPARKGKKL